MKNELIILSGKLLTFVANAQETTVTGELDKKLESLQQTALKVIQKWSGIGAVLVVAGAGIAYMWATDERESAKLMKTLKRVAIGLAVVFFATTIVNTYLTFIQA